MTPMFRMVLLYAAIILVSPLISQAESLTLPLPIQTHKIVSAKMGETREFWVALPDRYFTAREKYPVLYMMDGDFNFNSGIIGGLRYASMSGEIPEFIIVGIKNTDRSRDIFPMQITYADGSKGGGRADQYLDFILAELLPYITKQYRCQDYRVLYGTSNTGFTAMYALLRSPQLANAYIAASATLALPAFQDQREQLLHNFHGGSRQLVLVMGEHDLPTVLSHNGELKEKIDALAIPELTCRLAVIGNGGHVPVNALLEGLRLAFDGWKIATPLSEKTFSEIRAQVERRAEKYGLVGNFPEDDLRDLGNSLNAEKKYAKAIEVLHYCQTCYPDSADTLVSLGEAYRQSGQTVKARECLVKALQLVPGHGAASAKLKELDTK